MTSTTTFASGIQIDSALQIRTATEPFEISQLRVAAFDLDTSLFPGARQVASLTRYYQQKCGSAPKQETRHFILSI